MFAFFKKRVLKLRLARLKSHQLGIDVIDNEIEHESRVEDRGATVEETNDLIVTVPEEETTNENQNQSCSSTSDENISEFANSRTIIKP